MHSLLQDVRFSLRLMRKHPGMSCLVLAALILGIGVNSAMFSVINSLYLRPAPLHEPQRLAYLFAKSPQGPYMSVSYPEFLDWKSQSRSFQGLTAYEYSAFNLKGNGSSEQLQGWAVTASYFKIAGISPALGRDFSDADEHPGAARVAVLSYGLWQRRFGKDVSILGKTITLDGQLYSIIGVLPPNEFPLFGWDLWVGIGPFLDQHMMNRETRHVFVMGRLAPGVTMKQAREEMETIAGRLAVQYPQSNKDLGASVIGVMEMLTAADRKPLGLISMASALILLLACVNVLTVFIAGAIQRRKELSVRLALGAVRSAILRQLFVQSLIYAAIGASLGLALAKTGLVYLIGKFPLAVFRFRETTIDHTVVLFTVCLALGSTLLSSFLPTLYATRLNINSELKGEGSWTTLSRYRFLGQGALITFEVTLAASLSLVSGLLIKSFYQLEKADMGFSPHHIFCFRTLLPDTEYKDAEAKVAFYRRAVDNLKAIPGIQSATATYSLPLYTTTYFINLQVDSQSPHAAERPFVDSDLVLPAFFATMKIPMVQGRDFTEADRENSPPVAIVDEVLAATMWPGQTAIGKRIRLADITDNGPPWREIVGVVRQIKYRGPEEKVARMQVYEPLYQTPRPGIFFLVETTASIVALKPAAEKAIHAVAPDLALNSLQPLDEGLDTIESKRKVSLLLLSGFALVGIVLGVIGIYGVVANSVIRRQREIAIRMALGASMQNSIILVTRTGLLATLIGIGLGSLIVILLGKVLSAFLFGVTALDPEIYLFTIIVIIVLAFFASLIPASALLKLSPQDVLRQ